MTGERVSLKAEDADPLPVTNRTTILDKISRKKDLLNYSPYHEDYDPSNYQVTLGPWVDKARPE